jgi:hypothetical protein
VPTLLGGLKVQTLDAARFQGLIVDNIALPPAPVLALPANDRVPLCAAPA